MYLSTAEQVLGFINIERKWNVINERRKTKTKMNESKTRGRIGELQAQYLEIDVSVRGVPERIEENG